MSPRELRKVLAAKDLAHYSPRLLAKREAQVVVRNAAVLVEAAERLSHLRGLVPDPLAGSR